MGGHNGRGSVLLGKKCVLKIAADLRFSIKVSLSLLLLLLLLLLLPSLFLSLSLFFSLSLSLSPSPFFVLSLSLSLPPPSSFSLSLSLSLSLPSSFSLFFYYTNTTMAVKYVTITVTSAGVFVLLPRWQDQCITSSVIRLSYALLLYIAIFAVIATAECFNLKVELPWMTLADFTTDICRSRRFTAVGSRARGGCSMLFTP